MDKIDILLWAIGGGFGINFSLLLLIWKNLNSRIDKLDEKVTDIDRRLCRLEGAFTTFSSREFCAIRTESQIKKAE